MWVWLLLVAVRLGWSVYPQTGYIHPDEFFQTVEVVAGDALNISIVRTWEFTPSFTLRSVVLPKLLFHPVFKLLHVLDETIPSFQLTGSILISSSRLVMAILSIWIDWCTYNLSKSIGNHGYSTVLLIASSYVTMTYQTHTFTNSLESLLLMTVIFLLVKSVERDPFVVKKAKNLKVLKGDNKQQIKITDTKILYSTNLANLRRRKLHADSDSLPNRNYNQLDDDINILNQPSSLKNNPSYITVFLLAVVNTTGIFNRPTFVLFSVAPFIWWLYSFSFDLKLIFKRVMLFLFITFLTACLFLIVDTMYYHDLTAIEFLNLIHSRDQFNKILSTFAPLNFVLYNSVTSNLESHGRHPIYLHSLVNFPLLFGPLVFFTYRDFINKVFNFIKDLVFKSRAKTKSSHKRKDDDSLTKVPYLTFIIIPLLGLSLFPHQEPRFLIPLLPLVILHTIVKSKNLGNVFWSSFLFFNILLSIFYGCLHQGGVTPSLNHLQGLIKSEISKSEKFSANIIFSHTYMPPKHVLLLHNNANVNLIDFKGESFETLVDALATILKAEFSSLDTTDRSYFTKDLNKITKSISSTQHDGDQRSDSTKTFVVIPGSLIGEFRENCGPRFQLSVIKKFFPHLSLEDWPRVTGKSSVEEVMDLLSLYIVQVDGL